MTKTISIFVPAFNEADSIGAVVKQLTTLNSQYKVFVIDDGSTDETFEHASQAGAIVIRHPINLGGGAAIRTAFSIALLEKTDYIVTLDADSQHDPKELPDLLHQTEQNIGLVIGSRFLGDCQIRMKSYRQYGIRFFSSLISKIINKRVTDVTSGYRIYNRREIDKIYSQLDENQYYAIESLMHIAKNANIVEVPIQDITRIKGKSKKGLLRYCYHLFRVFLKGSIIHFS
jgi:glycosyltransferase involved in cell wall biosynthesis